jgi:hypothetical protein
VLQFHKEDLQLDSMKRLHVLLIKQIIVWHRFNIWILPLAVAMPADAPTIAPTTLGSILYADVSEANKFRSSGMLMPPRAL